MRTLRTIAEMQLAAESERGAGRRLAVVPTMGALHRGHVSLIERARTAADVVVTTIFVNPAQFGPNEDLTRYPRPFDSDVAVAGAAGSDIVFAPSPEEIYPEGFQTFVVNERAASGFEGAERPGHFRGVATIVAKLFLATKPHLAVFGQKDAQQVAVVKALIRDLNMDIELDVAPIVREPDGLALSSRNAYLSADERARSVVLYKALTDAQRRAAAGERSATAIRRAMYGILKEGRPDRIDYAAVVDPGSFVELEDVPLTGALAILAVRFGSTRLLDNMYLEQRKSEA
ncbi:MAG: pantoate--beta-alanine ligase [Bacteroidetes bacterium]|jgi:pantoate--beta-alanine ligase|nr:pantoate--beta-alanine ligase [Bacteroidota bacterium]